MGTLFHRSKNTTTGYAFVATGTFFVVNNGSNISILNDGAGRADANDWTGMILGAVFFTDFDHYIIPCIFLFFHILQAAIIRLKLVDGKGKIVSK